MGRSAKFFRLGQTKSERDRIRISKNTKVEKIQNVPERVKKVSNGARAGLEAVMADAPNTHDAVMTLVSSARSQKPRPASHAAPNSSKKPTLDKRGVPAKSKVLDKDYLKMMDSKKLQQQKTTK